MDPRVGTYIQRENQRYGAKLEQIPRAKWPPDMPRKDAPIEAWRSRDYLVMIFREPNGYLRLSALRTRLDGDRYADGISWDTLQRLKHECGRGDVWAVEVYPDDRNVVNVQNMRHLFLLTEAPAYGWTREQG